MTILELIVVLAIIAVLAVSMLPKFTEYITEAKKVSALDEAKSVVLAFESINLKSSLDEDSTIIEIETVSNGLLDSDNIKKLSKDLTYTNCINILNTEKYNFSFGDNGIVDSGDIKAITAN